MKYLLVIASLFLSSSVNACIAKLLPDIDKLDNYSNIYIIEVTGIVMHEYESDRAESITKGENKNWFTDVTQRHQVRGVVTKVFKGNPSVNVSHEIRGCGVQIPDPLMSGIIFEEKGSNKAIPIYENEGELYYELLIKMGSGSR